MGGPPRIELIVGEKVPLSQGGESNIIYLADLERREKSDRRRLKCRCGFCGETFQADMGDIRKNSTQSCGCQRYITISKKATGVPRTHGKVYEKYYQSWKSMKTRVRERTAICDVKFDNFEGFLESMGNGEILGRHSEEFNIIDRINSLDPEYAPNKCAWSNTQISTVNRACNYFIFIDTVTFLCSNHYSKLFFKNRKCGRFADINEFKKHFKDMEVLSYADTLTRFSTLIEFRNAMINGINFFTDKFKKENK